MASRSEKLYSDSPKTERGEDGKVSVKKKSDGRSAPKPKEDMTNTGVRHLREIREMHKRHADEHTQLNQRQEKEQAAEQQMPTATNGQPDTAPPGMATPAGAQPS